MIQKMKQGQFAFYASVLTMLLLGVPSASAQGVSSATAQAPDSRLIFQTGRPWSPRTNINADTVLVYGIDDSTAERIRSWREHGYHVDVMTGVAWGRYAPYLRGDFDGKEHWNETQQEKDGTLILHSGREVPYIAPTLSYGRYLAQGVKRRLMPEPRPSTLRSRSSGRAADGATASRASGRTTTTSRGRRRTARRMRSIAPRS